MPKPRSKPRRAASESARTVARSIYLDHSATTPLDPRVLDAMYPSMTDAFGNAASITHALGQAAALAVETARGQTAGLLNAEPKEIIWTSGATEANNLAIKGVAAAIRTEGRHLITQATEHNAILDACTWLQSEGFEVTVLPVDGTGRVRTSDVVSSLRPDTILVSIMYANNEIGTVQPIREIGAICRGRGIVFHTDATQAVGKIPVDVRADNIDLLSLSAHKLYGPKGCGALFVRNRTPRLRLVPLLHGGGHERGMRSGTLNVPGIVGLGVACELARTAMVAESRRIAALRDEFEATLLAQIPGAAVNGDRSHRLPHCTSLTFSGVEAEALLVAMPDLALSTGSACTSASVQPSHVLRAIGLSEAQAHSTLRVSLGRWNTQEEIAHSVRRIVESVHRLRELGSFN